VKSHIPIIVTVVLVVIGVAVGLLITPRLQSPQDKFDNQIEDKVALANQMLRGYKPGGMHLAAQLAATATQPANIPPDQWQENISYAKQESPYADPIKKMQLELNRLDQVMADLGNEPDITGPATSAQQGYSQLSSELQKNEQTISDALKIVSQAVGMRADAGDQVISGKNHPLATRMEAVLIYSQADLLRRQASIYHAMADENRESFSKTLSSWRHIDSAIRSLERDLSTQTPEKTETTTVVKAPAKPKPKPKPKQKPKAKKRSAKPAIFSNALKKLLGKEVKPPTPQEQPQDIVAETEQPEEQPPPEELPPAEEPLQEEPVQPANIVFEKLPTIQERIVILQDRQKEVVSAISDAKADVEKLNNTINTLNKQFKKAKTTAEKTEQQMLALKSAGIDPTDPESLNRFIAEYNKTAKTNRQATMEAAILEKGSIRNVRPDTDDINEMIDAPLVPINPNKKTTEVRGLNALKRDLQLAEGLVKTNTVLLEVIDHQIKELQTRKQDVNKRLAKMKTSRQNLLEQATEVTRLAVDNLYQADKLEKQALDLAANKGIPAAERAQAAAQRRINIARTANDSEKREEPVDTIVKDKFLGGHVDTLQGDIEHMIAMIQTQRNNGLDRHHWMLARTEEMGIKIDKDMLPEGVLTEDMPPEITQSQKAAQAAAQAKQLAVEAGEKALKLYIDADDDLKQIWVLHTNIAAVHYLLADLTTGQVAKGHRDNAIIEYKRSIKDRLELPEAKRYKRIIEGLSKKGAPGSE